MIHRLRRHPFPVVARFRHTLVLTYAVPGELLEPLLPRGLALDRFGSFGFVALAMVQTERLRPASWPAATGVNFFLTGYRVFAKYRTRDGRTLRGLRILRSDTDRWLMVLAGNALTHYRYRHATVNWQLRAHQLHVRIGTPRAVADVDVIANLASCPARLPAASVFRNEHDARRFAGPLPYTFDYEAATNSIIRIEGVRQHWEPQLVDVDVRRATFFDAPPFQGESPRLVSAFYLHDVAYRWERGIVESLAEEDR